MFCDRLAPAEEPEDRRARGGVGRRHEEDAVEAAGPAEGRVEVPGRVGRGQDQHALVATRRRRRARPGTG